MNNTCHVTDRYEVRYITYVCDMLKLLVVWSFLLFQPTNAKQTCFTITFIIYFMIYKSLFTASKYKQGAFVIVIIWRLDLQLPMQSVPITTKVMCLNPVHGEVYLIQHYVIQFVSDLLQVSGFLRVLRFPPPIKLTATISLKYC